MKKLCRILFSRYFISAVLILAELVLIFCILLIAYDYSLLALLTVMAVNLFVLIGLINRDANPEYKVSWLVVIMLFPPFGAVLYFLFYQRRVGKKEADFMREIQDCLNEAERRGADSFIEQDVDFSLLKARDRLAAGKALSILIGDRTAEIYSQTEARFFSTGESMYESMLADIASAEKYIFLEYFIIDDGVMWRGIYKLLCDKAKAGVEVRVMYDDIGCMRTLPAHYDRILRKEGIKCLRFSPVTPRVSNAHNNRNHRKILIVDGRAAYTGGVNLADEYINRKERFGYWKDGGIRVEGDAVRGFLKLFLSSWCFAAGKICDTLPYLDSVKPAETADGGYYIPFGTGPAPIYDRSCGKGVLLNFINQAADYVYITTPYLVVDYGLTEALRNAALRGVDVRIVTPGIPDKKTVKLMTKSAYPYLMSAGVRIYEYKGGFIHEKSLVSDDLYAMVGTINLDYRSLVHHFEDAVWIYGSPAVLSVKEAFFETVEKSDACDGRGVRLGFFEKLVRNLVRIFAPLL